jgi:probable rRNA maturation factor
MARVHLTIQIESPFVGAISRPWLRRIVRATIAAAGVSSPLELSLVIAGDETVHALNRQYRGVDRTTDVLAFPLAESADGAAFASPDGSTRHLGDVVVSFPRAKQQAAEFGHSLESELALLVAHGVLHLLGYDHEEPEDERRMKAMEAQALSTIEC